VELDRFHGMISGAGFGFGLWLTFLTIFK
jgi:hypothetical protein